MKSIKVPDYITHWVPDSETFRTHPSLAYDLGSGSNLLTSIFLVTRGYLVYAVDQEIEVKSEKPSIRSIQENVMNMVFERCDLIVAADLFQFLKKSEKYQLFEKLFSTLNSSGLCIFSSFTVDDPSYLKISRFTKIEEETFSSPDGSKIFSYFSRAELREYLAKREDIEVLDYVECIEEDTHPPQGDHIHGMVKFVARKR